MTTGTAEPTNYWNYSRCHWTVPQRDRASRSSTTNNGLRSKGLSARHCSRRQSHTSSCAFLTEDIDEFVAHMTTVEAALGLHADYDRPGATSRLRARIAALLSDNSAADLHRELFSVRSCYLHGRGMEGRISSEKRKGARRLARRVVEALVARAKEVSAPTTREDFLSSLLDRAPAGRG